MDQEPMHASLDQLILRWLPLLPRGNLHVRAAFATFVRRSPRHLFTYLRHKTLETELAELDPERRIDVDALIAKARSGEHVVVLTQPAAPPHGVPADAFPPPPRRLAGAVAYVIAILAICASPIFMQRRDLPHETYATTVGERREITLPDKTRLLLNTDSKVLVDFTVSKRQVRVLEGEVIVTVHHQRRWPFQARVGDDVIQDWGTQFDIRVLPHGSSIVVTQGVVLVHHVLDVLQEKVGPPGNRSLFAEANSDAYPPVRLVTGDEVRIASAGRQRVSAESVHLSAEELASRIAWEGGSLQFSGQTLNDVVAEFGRYTPLQIEVDPSIAQLRLGGRFDPTDPISFVRSLERLGVMSDTDSVLRTNGRVIHLRPAESSLRAYPREHP